MSFCCFKLHSDNVCDSLHQCINAIGWFRSGYCYINSLDFWPALLLLPLHTFFTMEGDDSEFVNFTGPTLKAFLEACSQNVSGNNACALGCHKTLFFSHELAIFWSAQKQCRDTFFPLQQWWHLYCFTILGSTSIHCYTQHEAAPTQKLAQEVTLLPLTTSCAKDY